MDHIQSIQEFVAGELEIEADARRKARRADQLVIDWQNRGPLHQYVMERQSEAIGAVRELVNIDPNDAANIAKLQARIESFIDVRSWIDGVAAAGDAADKFLTGDDQGDADPNGYHYTD